MTEYGNKRDAKQEELTRAVTAQFEGSLMGLGELADKVGPLVDAYKHLTGNEIKPGSGIEFFICSLPQGDNDGESGRDLGVKSKDGFNQTYRLAPKIEDSGLRVNVDQRMTTMDLGDDSTSPEINDQDIGFEVETTSQLVEEILSGTGKTRFNKLNDLYQTVSLAAQYVGELQSQVDAENERVESEEVAKLDETLSALQALTGFQESYEAADSQAPAEQASE